MIDEDGCWPEWLVRKIAGEERWGKLNEKEKKLACKDPFGANNMNKAWRLTDKWGVEMMGDAYWGDNNIGNAFRHAFWNAAGTFMMGASKTKKFTDAHEWGEYGQSTIMDSFNNKAGRSIATLYKKELKRYQKSLPQGMSRVSGSGAYIDYFYYYNVKISLTGDHYANIALMVNTATNQGNGVVLRWIK